MEESPKIVAFKGLNNVTDEYRLGFDWQTTVDNLDITKTGAIQARDGYKQSLPGNITGAYSKNGVTMIVDGGVLKRLNDDLSVVAVKSGLVDGEVFWAEINGQVFYSGKNKGIAGAQWMPLSWEIPPAPNLFAGTGNLPAGTYQATCTRILSDGRETGNGDVAEITLPNGGAIMIDAPDDCLVYIARNETFQLCETRSWFGEDLGVELVTQFLKPIPVRARQITFWQSRLCAAEYFPDRGYSLIWLSEPLGFHLFKEFIPVKGEVRQLAGASGGLIIGTDEKIYAYNGMLEPLADYGAIAGEYAEDGNRVIFWTGRGLCAALPFENITENQISVAPGIRASVALIEKDGEKRVVASLSKGGAAYNSR